MYTRRDYDRCVNRTIGWVAGGLFCLAAGGLLGVRRGFTMRALGLSLAGSSACLAMAARTNLRDFENSRL